MAFDKLIIKSITGAAKSGIKMDLALDTAKEKLTDTVAGKVEDNIPFQLPFSTRQALKGNVNLNPNLLTPDYINQFPELTPLQKQQVTKTLDELELMLNVAITQKNALQGALTTITSPLTTLESLASTVGGIITGVRVGVNIIKALPIPSSVPPGIGIPLNVINGFSDALDTLKTVLDKFGGSLKIIPQAIGQINDILIPIVDKFKILDELIDRIIKVITFIRLLLSLPVTQSDVESTKQDLTNKIQESLALNVEIITQDDGEISFPINYKGFVLTVEFDPDNTFSFPARRIKAENATNVKLYSSPPDQGSGEVNTSSTYSYSSSTKVLIDEVKFNIDQYLLKNPKTVQNIDTQQQLTALVSQPATGNSGTSSSTPPPGYAPFGEPGTASGEVRLKGGKYWRYLGGTQDKWVEHTISLLPVGRKGVYDGEEHVQRLSPPEPFPRSTYKWSDLFYKWMYQGTQTGAV